MRLVKPTPALRAEFLEMAAEFLAAGGGCAEQAIEDFDAYLEECRRAEAGEVEGSEPQLTFWLVDDGRVLGTCHVRPSLNAALERDGGNIGCDVRPGARNRGHGTRMLGLALDEAWAIGLGSVLITADEANAASVRVVEKNNGLFLDRVPDSTILRFRIDVAARMVADEGIVAVGDAVTAERVLRAYRQGIFPWPVDEAAPMIWWSPDPRFVLYPSELHVGRSLDQRARSGRFELSLDTGFEAVIDGCTRPGGWITPEIRAAYVELFGRGHAHSVESRRDGRLVGGLYGVALGGVFFGESMFAHESDASKVAFVRLVRQLEAWGFALIDCQQETDHLVRFGARAVAREQFLRELRSGRRLPDRLGPWRFDEAV